MTRLATSGFEWGGASAKSCHYEFEGVQPESPSAAQGPITTNPRTGAWSFQAANDSVQNGIYIHCPVTTVAGRRYFVREYIWTSQQPVTQAVEVMRHRDASGAFPWQAYISGIDSSLRLAAPLNTLVFTGPVLQSGRWYCLEISWIIGTGAGDDSLDLRLDGALLYSATGLSIGTSVGAGCSVAIGSMQAGAAGLANVYIDDFALNDDQGSAPHNTWPDEGSIVLLRPTADAQRGSWTGGAGGTTNLWDALDNQPPAGTASETDTTQIENADGSADNATDEYRATMQTYAAAGIGPSDTIRFVQAIVMHGEDVATGTKTGSVLIASNPAQGAADTFTFGDNAGALAQIGTLATTNNWRTKLGTPVNTPSVTLSTAPEVHLRKTDTGTRVVAVCGLGIYVEYVSPKLKPAIRALQAVAHASVR